MCVYGVCVFICGGCVMCRVCEYYEVTYHTEVFFVTLVVSVARF